MSAYTLDSIRDAAEKKYGSTDIDLGNGTVVKLVNALRLPKERRTELMTIQDDLDSDGDQDQADLMAKAIEIVAETPAQAKSLLTMVGDDLALLAQIFETYAEGTQAGEA